MVERTITLLCVRARTYCENQRTWYTSYCIDSLTVNLVSACAVIEYRTFNQAKRLLWVAVWGIFFFDILIRKFFILSLWNDMAVLQPMRYWWTHARTNKCAYAHTSWYVRLQPNFLSLALHCYSSTFFVNVWDNMKQIFRWTFRRGPCGEFRWCLNSVCDASNS